MQTGPGQHVNLAIEQCLEILTKPHDVQQRTVRIHVHEEIDVAVRAVIATRDGPEHTEVVRPVLRRYSKDVVAFLLQVHAVSPIFIVDGRGPHNRSLGTCVGHRNEVQSMSDARPSLRRQAAEESCVARREPT
jgi:hypothetical protein